MSRSECDAIRPLISAALDGDLDEDEFVQLSEHLATCAACRQVHQDYSRIRDDLRSTPAPAPPPALARNVWQETVEKPPPSTIVRLASRTGLKFGMSTMAASIIAILVVVMFAAHGYDRSRVPTVASSQPIQESVQEWPVSRPIEIEFSKQMNRESVERNLIIWPTSEHDRLPTSWSGNSLIIGRSENHSVLLRPETDYRITILEHAEDRHGNPIGDFWVLQFRTGPPDVAVATPAPERDRTKTEPEQDEIGADSWLFGQGDLDNDAADPPADEGQEKAAGESHSEGDAEATEPAGEQEVTEPDPEPAAEEERVDPQPEQPQPTPEQPEEPDTEPTQEPTQEPVPTEPGEPAEPEPTATPEPEPTATATVAPAPTPSPSPSPTQPATPEPTPSPTVEPYPVRGVFGEVYWSDPALQEALGEPVQEAYSFLAEEQEFQRGMMLRQYSQDRNSIIVFINGGPVRVFDNTYNPDEHDFPAIEESEGLYIPGGSFGKLWSENESIASDIGYAVSEAPIDDVDAGIQQFENGTLLYSRGSVYVMYGDGSWDVFSVHSSSSNGFQGGDDSEDEGSPDENGTDDADEHQEQNQDGDAEPTPDSDTDNVEEDNNDENVDDDEEAAEAP